MSVSFNDAAGRSFPRNPYQSQHKHAIGFFVVGDPYQHIIWLQLGALIILVLVGPARFRLSQFLARRGG